MLQVVAIKAGDVGFSQPEVWVVLAWPLHRSGGRKRERERRSKRGGERKTTPLKTGINNMRVDREACHSGAERRTAALPPDLLLEGAPGVFVDPGKPGGSPVDLIICPREGAKTEGNAQIKLLLLVILFVCILMALGYLII